MKKIIVSKKDNFILFFLLKDGKEIAINAYEESEESVLNNIYVCRVKDVVRNINAAFLEYAPDKVAYMSLDETPIFLNNKNTNKVCEGDLILAQIIKDAVKTKAPVMSSKLTLTGKYVILDSNNQSQIGISKKISDRTRIEEIRNFMEEFKSDEYGFIVRTEAENISNKEIISETKSLINRYVEMINIAKTRTRYTIMYISEKQLYKDIMSSGLSLEDEIITDSIELFNELKSVGFPVRLYEDEEISLWRNYSLEKKLADATSKNVWLKNGGYLVIEPTEALTVIDVNTGKFDGNIKNKEESFLKINIEAAKEIARQIKLRNLSGIIVVDFINLNEEKNQKELLHEFDFLLREDPVKTKLVDLTKLGLVEITRQKIRKPLYEIINKKLLTIQG